MDRTTQYAKVGGTTLFEIRNQWVFATQAWYEPIIPDWLEKVVVDSQFPDKAHADSGTPQIHREYTITAAMAAVKKSVGRRLRPE
jgi:hypothetical protein